MWYLRTCVVLKRHLVGPKEVIGEGHMDKLRSNFFFYTGWVLVTLIHFFFEESSLPLPDLWEASCFLDPPALLLFGDGEDFLDVTSISFSTTGDIAFFVCCSCSFSTITSVTPAAISPGVR